MRPSTESVSAGLKHHFGMVSLALAVLFQITSVLKLKSVCPAHQGITIMVLSVW